jgi:molybdopterin-guanine dinucleotide biosynthesis protein A
MDNRSDAPVVAVLAGGRGERLGGGKPTALLAERPLISYPMAAARAAGLEALVVAKPQTPLPPLAERVLYEHETLHHPLAGVVAALEEGHCVIAVACDMPFIPAALLRWFAQQPAHALVGCAGGRLAPFPALYRTGQIDSLRSSMLAQRSMRASIERLRPQIADDRELRPFGAQARIFFSVNTPADLHTAERWLRPPRPAAAGQL